MKVKDIKAGSLSSESRKNRFLWYMRYFNRVTKAKQKLNKANILNLSLNNKSKQIKRFAAEFWNQEMSQYLLILYPFRSTTSYFIMSRKE